ncbi:MAG TPA: response regulator [Myxococcaceae bacterium]|nr:response regulator [Myxococcaceae bacterium]
MPMPEKASATKPLILVVDDYDDSREMYAELLEASGFRVAEARDGRQSLEKAQQLLPDLVLMDLTLPGIDGLEATRRLKLDPRTRNIPVVALSGHDAGELAKGMADIHWAAFLTKPCVPEALLAELKRALAAACAN